MSAPQEGTAGAALAAARAAPPSEPPDPWLVVPPAAGDADANAPAAVSAPAPAPAYSAPHDKAAVTPTAVAPMTAPPATAAAAAKPPTRHALSCCLRFLGCASTLLLLIPFVLLLVLPVGISVIECGRFTPQPGPDEQPVDYQECKDVFGNDDGDGVGTVREYYSFNGFGLNWCGAAVRDPDLLDATELPLLPEGDYELQEVQLTWEDVEAAGNSALVPQSMAGVRGDSAVFLDSKSPATVGIALAFATLALTVVLMAARLRSCVRHGACMVPRELHHHPSAPRDGARVCTGIAGRPGLLLHVMLIAVAGAALGILVSAPASDPTAWDAAMRAGAPCKTYRAMGSAFIGGAVGIAFNVICSVILLVITSRKLPEGYVGSGPQTVVVSGAPGTHAGAAAPAGADVAVGAEKPPVAAAAAAAAAAATVNDRATTIPVASVPAPTDGEEAPADPCWSAVCCSRCLDDSSAVASITTRAVDFVITTDDGTEVLVATGRNAALAHTDMSWAVTEGYAPTPSTTGDIYNLGSVEETSSEQQRLIDYSNQFVPTARAKCCDMHPGWTFYEEVVPVGSRITVHGVVSGAATGHAATIEGISPDAPLKSGWRWGCPFLSTPVRLAGVVVSGSTDPRPMTTERRAQVLRALCERAQQRNSPSALQSAAEALPDAPVVVPELANHDDAVPLGARAEGMTERVAAPRPFFSHSGAVVHVLLAIGVAGAVFGIAAAGAGVNSALPGLGGMLLLGVAYFIAFSCSFGGREMRTRNALLRTGVTNPMARPGAFVRLTGRVRGPAPGLPLLRSPLTAKACVMHASYVAKTAPEGD